MCWYVCPYLVCARSVVVMLACGVGVARVVTVVDDNVCRYVCCLGVVLLPLFCVIVIGVCVSLWCVCC